jgi:hypothetical protein
MDPRSIASSPSTAPSQATEARPEDLRNVDLHQSIAQLAYELWRAYDEPAHRSQEIWLEAEKQLLGADPRISHTGGGAVATSPLAGVTRANPGSLDSAKANLKTTAPTL